MTTHHNGGERGVCARGVAEEEILGGAMGRVEGDLDVGDSGNTFVMDSLSRRTLVTALGIGGRTPVLQGDRGPRWIPKEELRWEAKCSNLL